MDGTRLSELVSQRHAVLTELLDISNRQVDAITGARMTELMSLLAEKQAPLLVLNELSATLRQCSGDNADKRVWESGEARRACRRENETCERMLVKLLAMEAECETLLARSRETLQQQLGRAEGARQAISGYSKTDAKPTVGGQLDLSSH